MSPALAVSESASSASESGDSETASESRSGTASGESGKTASASARTVTLFKFASIYLFVLGGPLACHIDIFIGGNFTINRCIYLLSTRVRLCRADFQDQPSSFFALALKCKNLGPTCNTSEALNRYCQPLLQLNSKLIQTKHPNLSVRDSLGASDVGA